MPFAARSAVAAYAVALCAVVTACGGSVADADLREARAASATTAPAANPFCAASRASSAAIGPLNTLVGRGNVNPNDLAKAVDAVRRSETDLLGTAPADIRADVQTTVDAVDADLRRWVWTVRLGPITLRLEHGVLAQGDGSRTWLTVNGPLPLIVGYAPLARFALGRLVAR